MRPISRREFGAYLAAGAVGGRFSLAGPFAGPPSRAITAAQIVERIRGNIGVEWRSETVDTIKAGDPATVVTGIVTTGLASLPLLRRAVQAGANMIITAQPTFHSRADAATPPRRGGPGAAPQADTPPPDDPVFTAKNRFIEENGLVVFRLSDHWRARRPNPVAEGLGDALGGAAYRVGGDPARYEIPAMTLEELAAHVKERLGARGGIRVVGRPGIQVRRVAQLPGSTSITAALETMPGVDVVIGGEMREWESVEYARDAVHAGQPKGLILVGRILSEEPGMALCARWLTTIVPEVPVRHIAAGDPYWRPA